MKNDETPKAAKARTKNGGLVEMLGNMFTTDAKENEAIARKIMKTAVKLLSMLAPAFLASLIKCFFR
jgi:hypothetical protein